MLKRFVLMLLMTLSSLASTATCSARSPAPAPATSSPEAARICPILPADADMYWILQPGPDFDVCYGVLRGGKHSVIGIYMGMYPSFRPAEATPIGPGTVAGRRVTWYQGAPHDEGRTGTLVRQTLMHIDPPHYYEAHAWVSAKDRNELAKRLSVLARMRFH